MTSQLSVLRFIRKLFCCSFFLIYSILIFNNLLFADNKNSFRSFFPATSASHSDNVFAPFINPVFSDIAPSPSISYMMQQFEDTNNGNHFLLTNFAGFIFSYSWIDNFYNYRNDEINTARTRHFTFGKGFFFGNIFGIGLNYSFTKGNNDYDDYRSFTTGLLFRPFRFLSLAYVARDINNPEPNKNEIPRSDVFSVSVRPFKFLTISCDAVKYKDQKFDSSDLFYSANLRLIYDISLFASTNVDKNFSFGLTMPIGIPYTRNITSYIDAFANISNTSVPDSAGFGITIARERTKFSPVVPESYLKITLNNSISELKIRSLFSKEQIIFYDILNAINRASNDDSIAALILQIDDTELGFGQIQELRNEIKLFRRKNKKAYAILNTFGNMEYYLAASCDEIYFSPMNVFAITGLKAEVFFIKQGLDKIGVKFESVKKGTYKSYPETFVREHMSPAFRENMTSILSDLNDQFFNDISIDRKLSRENIDNLLQSGFLKPVEAVRSGFIDQINYPIESENIIKKKHGSGLSRIKMEDFIEQKIKNYAWGPSPEIAVIYVTGSITRGESRGYRDISPSTTGDLTYYKSLQTAFKDPNVRAVIIRIDSGGGSAAASELMWHYLVQFKRKYKKPVIFSFGNMAASGGYYIACTGDKIIGNKGSITGSIGVVTGKISLQELYKKLGINKDIIKMSKFADIFSEAKDFSDEERNVIQRGVDYTYNRFTEKVSAGRGIEKKHIDNIAQGRVFTGNQAKENGLIDNFGGLLAAIELAKKSAKLKETYNIKHLPEISAPLIDILGLDNGIGLMENLKKYAQIFEFIDFKDEHFLYYFPYKIKIE